ncbi:signal peptide peptidase SppA [Aliidiomarina quisquiliarum]|uniref:signal peptide peptidase SppA n=1 Tax=Aliidiomarina quisquiliarum TaxID=2938947 RepID=UPI00208EBE20|nr:signal peptide peptidase SppA [Aliidiomarina quisquiliarum]MCO4320832.1 signal peptide peptidase SppA [Aliidiomarina quisquiliarum]
MRFLFNLLRPIGRFINNIRRVIVNFVFFIILAAVLLMLVSGDETIEVKPHSLLVLDLSGIIVEQETYVSAADRFAEQAFGMAESAPESYLYDILAAIDRAQYDDRISGISLQLDYFWGAGLSKLQQVGERLIRFRAESGKPVIASGDYFSQSQYYLAAHADQVLLHTEGAVVIEGFHAYQNYFATLFDKLHVRAHIFKAGDYKTATEPYQRDNMSDQARHQGLVWLNDLWQQYLVGISAQRVIHQQILSGRITDYLYALEAADFSEAQLALQTGLVDALMSRYEIKQTLIAASGHENDEHSYNAISYRDYLRTFTSLPEPTEQHIIEVIIASGTLFNGYSSAGAIGGDSLAAQLREARLNEQVKAVVLRIDSPGGSAFAAEVVRQEMLRFKQVNKPIYASFSSTAASGGYWIALGADKIYAAPTTITGSIGVFGLFLSIEDSLNTIGIGIDGISTTEMPFIDPAKTLDPTAELIIQHSVDRTYRTFLDLVATHRKLSPQHLQQLADGRVWTGRQAVKHGLVDALADLGEVLEQLSADYQIEDYYLKMPSKQQSSLDHIIEQLFSAQALVGSFMLKHKLLQQNSPNAVANNNRRALSQLFIERQLKEFSVLTEYNDPRGLYSRCTECREVF